MCRPLPRSAWRCLRRRRSHRCRICKVLRVALGAAGRRAPFAPAASGGHLGHVRDLLLLVRRRPWRLLAAFALSLVIDACVVTGVVTIAATTGIGELTAADYMFAVPLTLVTNAIPFTPNGIGVGEAAFDQICRWLEPMPSGAAYSSVFLAFRAF